MITASRAQVLLAVADPGVRVHLNAPHTADKSGKLYNTGCSGCVARLVQLWGPSLLVIVPANIQQEEHIWALHLCCLGSNVHSVVPCTTLLQLCMHASHVSFKRS